MGGWALPPVAAQELEQLMDLLRSTGNAERFKPFVKGGNWLNYFVKYPESNHLHKRALHISRQYQARASDGQVQQEDWYCRGLEALHRAQCNDGYWHGVFGGLYMAHLRHAICQNLVEAELLLERSSHALPTWSTIETGDLDCDLKTEVLLSTDKLSAFLDPAEGGAVYELNFKPRLFNVVNTLARRPESYHRKIPLAAPHSPEASFAESEGPHDSNKVRSCSTQELQQHDYGRRGLFQDQLLLPSTEFAEYRQWNLPTADGFFLEQYELQLEQKTALLSRCHCWHLNPEYSLLAHYKNVRMAEAGMLECQHRWICKEGKVAANHLCALNFSFLTDGDPQKFMAFNGEWNRLGLSWTGSRLDVRTLELADGWAGFHLVIQFEPACCIWTFPVKTISQSEGGYEQNYQCSFFGVLWPLRLESGQESHSQITIAAEEWSS
jgi:alpha-amylase